MSADVPRRATFDDLRVGQWVAWCDGSDAWVSRLTAVDLPNLKGDDGGGSRRRTIAPDAVERGEVTILRDAPASPVTVRREDYDALVAQWEAEPTLQRGWITGRIREAVRALIDNADTGDTP